MFPRLSHLFPFYDIYSSSSSSAVPVHFVKSFLLFISFAFISIVFSSLLSSTLIYQPNGNHYHYAYSLCKQKQQKWRRKKKKLSDTRSLLSKYTMYICTNNIFFTYVNDGGVMMQYICACASIGVYKRPMCSKFCIYMLFYKFMEPT